MERRSALCRHGRYSYLEIGGDVLGPRRCDSLLRGLDHLLVARIKKVGVAEASDAGNKTGEFQEHVNKRSKCKVEDQEAEDGSSSIGNGYGMQPREGNVLIPNEFNLSGVLHSLMSLDPQGDFMGPLHGVFATNHSKVIEASMCFAMLQEKIRTRQYSAWHMFVEDFEWICYIALKCNHKRSNFWTAANDLLRRGKKRLEQYERWRESLVALNKTGGLYASFNSKLGVPTRLKSENVETRVCQHKKYLVTEGLKMAIPSATTVSPESKPRSSGAASLCRDSIVGKDTCSMQRSKEEKWEDQMTRNTAPFLAPVLNVVSEENSNVSREARVVESRSRVSEGEPDNSLSPVRETLEDVDIEEERDADSGEYRVDLDGEATESSSSFGSDESALGGEVGSDCMQSMFEAESDLRNGNGAGGLREDEDGLLTGERGQKALDTDWKLYRRGIEWRCRWLELKTQLIKAKINQYDQSLRNVQSAKIWKWEGEVGEGRSARTLPVKILRNHPVMLRKHRRRAEDAEDLDLGKHPVFSRYGTGSSFSVRVCQFSSGHRGLAALTKKRKIQRKADDDLPQGKVDSKQVLQTGYETDEAEDTLSKVDMQQQPGGRSTLVRENSMESILFRVEALQARVKRALHILRKGAPSRNIIVSTIGTSNLSPRTLPHASQRGTLSPQKVHRAGSLTISSPKAVSRGGPPSSSSAGAGRTGSGLARRKSADYDINNMIMPQGLGTSNAYLEQVRHVNIETPQWRVIEDAEQPDQESSSDEDTTDEHYGNRHAEMEMNELQHRHSLPLKKTAGKGKTLKLGKGKSALKMTSKGSSANLALPSRSVSFVERPADSVPKRQRSKIYRRPKEATLAEQARSSDVIVVKSEVKSEVFVEDAKVDPLGVENGDVAATTAEKCSTSVRMEEY